MEHLNSEHVGALAAVGVLAAGAVALARRGPPGAGRRLGQALALALALAYLGEQLAYALRGDWRITLNLPFHLTDAVTAAAVVALATERRLAVELTWFWALTASLLAMLTPELGRGFPDVYFLTFFATHGGAVIAAALLVLGRRLVPRPGAVRRAFAATVVVAGAATAANLLTGANYMYLRAKPSTPSLLDLLGPWPVYVLAVAALAPLLFCALYAPFRGARHAR